MSSQPEKTNKPLRVYADRSACCGYGLCNTICPEVYKIDDGGMVYLESNVVPEGCEEMAVEGAEACPADVLRVETGT